MAWNRAGVRLVSKPFLTDTMSNTIAVIMLAALAAVAVWAQWCAIKRAEDLACKLAAMRDEARRLRDLTDRLRAELEAKR
jgi:hypothetical protein